jgi:hypothetical protein
LAPILSSKEKTNWQFWIGSPTARLDLFIWSTMAFYMFLYHSDELSMVVPPAATFAQGHKIGVGSPTSITFINSGSGRKSADEEFEIA